MTSALLAIPQIHPDPTPQPLPSSAYLRWEDPEHIIEIEVSGAGPTTVSLRFAVCHPSSIDDVFADLVVHLATALNADAVVEEDDSAFAPSQSKDLRNAVLRSIPQERALWQANFGRAEARLSCRDAIDRFVVG